MAASLWALVRSESKGACCAPGGCPAIRAGRDSRSTSSARVPKPAHRGGTSTSRFVNASFWPGMTRQRMTTGPVVSNHAVAVVGTACGRKRVQVRDPLQGYSDAGWTDESLGFQIWPRLTAVQLKTPRPAEHTERALSRRRSPPTVCAKPASGTDPTRPATTREPSQSCTAARRRTRQPPTVRASGITSWRPLTSSATTLRSLHFRA